MNPKCYNSVIAKRSIQLYLYVCLFTLRIPALVNAEFENLPKVNHVYDLLLLDYEVRLVYVRN